MHFKYVIFIASIIVVTKAGFLDRSHQSMKLNKDVNSKVTFKSNPMPSDMVASPPHVDVASYGDPK